jgi:NADPH-dependent glutamate synthase beta subunit-like oxidoreductase
MELRELSHSPNVDVIVHPEGFELDEGSMEAIRGSKSVKLVVDVLQNYLAKEPTGAAHRIHIHFCQNPVEVLGVGGKVSGLRTEITELDGTGNVRGTGEFKVWPVQAVYRAVGYRSDNLAGIPFDDHLAVVPNDGGRVIDIDGDPLPGAYVTGWIKRGPVGLIGHTKSDAAQTIELLLLTSTRSSLPTSPNAKRSTAPSRVAAWSSRRGKASSVSRSTRSPWAKPRDVHASRSSPATKWSRSPVANPRDLDRPAPRFWISWCSYIQISVTRRVWGTC